MALFLTTYLRVLLLTAGVPLAFGLVCYFCSRLFFRLTDSAAGRPLLLAASVLSTPVREASHAVFAALFCHRIDDIALFTLHGEEGELGFVAHSYNPRNPVALLGNFFFAMGPAASGLFLVLIVLLVFFQGTTGAFLSETAALGDASFAVCARAALRFLVDLFRAPGAAFPLRALGCLLLLALASGIYVSPDELRDAWSGMLLYAGGALLFSGVISMLGPRLPRIVLSGLFRFSVCVTALFTVVLASFACLIAAGLLTFAAGRIGAGGTRDDRS